MKISVVRDILEANDRIAQQNKELFKENNMLVSLTMMQIRFLKTLLNVKKNQKGSVLVFRLENPNQEKMSPNLTAHLYGDQVCS